MGCYVSLVMMTDNANKKRKRKKHTRWVRGCDLYYTWVALALPGAPAKPPGLCHLPDTLGTFAATGGTSYAEWKKEDRKTKHSSKADGWKKLLMNKLNCCFDIHKISINDPMTATLHEYEIKSTNFQWYTREMTIKSQTIYEKGKKLYYICNSCATAYDKKS